MVNGKRKKRKRGKSSARGLEREREGASYLWKEEEVEGKRKALYSV